MSKLFDYLTNSPSATPVNASFEVQAQETPAPQPAVTVQPASSKKRRFKRIGKPTGQPAVSAEGKTLTVVASSQKDSEPRPLQSFLKDRLNIRKDFKTVTGSKFFKKTAPIAAGAMFAMPVAAGAMLAFQNRKAIGAGIKKVATGNFVKKTAPAAAIAAGMPIMAAASLVKKGGIKKVFKKFGRRR